MGKLQITNGECRNLECFGVCTIFQYIIRLALVIPAITNRYQAPDFLVIP
jgi:hypothetical protein